MLDLRNGQVSDIDHLKKCLFDFPSFPFSVPLVKLLLFYELQLVSRRHRHRQLVS